MNFERQDTYNKIVDIVSATLAIEKNTITPQSKFETLGADSLDMLSMIMKFEENFGVEIDDTQAAKITTVQEAVDALQGMRTK